MKVVFLTTSYPRHEGDVAGSFVRAAAERLRAAGTDVEVVSPASFRHYGVAFGDGIVNNLRRHPWLVLALPLFLWSFTRAARRAAVGADVVHAHWIPSALPGLLTRRPVVLQLWGSDAALAARARWAVRPLVRRARVVVCASRELAREAEGLGAREVRVVPADVDAPPSVGPPEAPPHALYVGRLSEEKGVRELAVAAEGLPLVVVGDGPLRELFPGATGFVPHDRLGPYYEAASVVVVPSRREGYGMTAREAMAHGRPVVATAVGGLLDAVEDGVSGLLVPPGDVAALRGALERLLTDESLREQLGDAARERALSWSAGSEAAGLLAAYRAALRAP
jgi:glycosyltransferase involved in cell wall biosynthesis